MTSKNMISPGERHPRQFSLMTCLLRATGVLVIPLALLLFAQWPLREWVQAWSLQANDLAQIVFAVYVAVAITAASRAKTHLAAVPMSQLAWPTSAWRAGLMLACVGPWALFILWTARAQILNSVMGLEQFGETQTPGFFMIKLALGILLVLVFIEAVTTWWAAWRHKD